MKDSNKINSINRRDFLKLGIAATIHFTGDHTSPWNGWMNGALESGNRAAAEIKARG